MDFEISDKMQTILDMIGEFLEKEIYPFETELHHLSGRDIEAELAPKREMVKQMDLWAPNHPKEYDGADEVHKISLARGILRGIERIGKWQL